MKSTTSKKDEVFEGQMIWTHQNCLRLLKTRKFDVLGQFDGLVVQLTYRMASPYFYKSVSLFID
jgi:hypothetical protein